jgi:hypothetical protein
MIKLLKKILNFLLKFIKNTKITPPITVYPYYAVTSVGNAPIGLANLL